MLLSDCVSLFAAAVRDLLRGLSPVVVVTKHDAVEVKQHGSRCCGVVMSPFALLATLWMQP